MRSLEPLGALRRASVTDGGKRTWYTVACSDSNSGSLVASQFLKVSHSGSSSEGVWHSRVLESSSLPLAQSLSQSGTSRSCIGTREAHPTDWAVSEFPSSSGLSQRPSLLPGESSQSQRVSLSRSVIESCSQDLSIPAVSDDRFPRSALAVGSSPCLDPTA